MALNPFVVRLHSFIPSKIIWVVSLLFLAICDHFDWVVNQQWWLKDFTSDILSALWALLFSHHAFSYAIMAKRVTTDRYTTTNNIIHTNRTCQSFNFSHWRIGCFLLIIYFVFQILKQQFFRRNLRLLYDWWLFLLNWFAKAFFSSFRWCFETFVVLCSFSTKWKLIVANSKLIFVNLRTTILLSLIANLSEHIIHRFIFRILNGILT